MSTYSNYSKNTGGIEILKNIGSLFMVLFVPFFTVALVVLGG